MTGLNERRRSTCNLKHDEYNQIKPMAEYLPLALFKSGKRIN
ncbi:hypothetical protein HMPREF1622_00443 [Escherichia coli A35218R]|nr:hypothetical protein HMPREF1622_00443 [Escherichia coli A35218R]